MADGTHVIAQLVQVPAGTVAEVAPVYFVTYLSSVSPDLEVLSNEESYRVHGATSVIEVIEWARANVPDEAKLLLVEVSVTRDDSDAPHHRSRVWYRMPDTIWARAMGRGYTY
ncbi:MAG: hypothetical protein LBJ02_04905 [Bifidobacteriaceae bacterium]|jgi:hypothetical protein|nr:hypothetical protein [Bifidobacteriaceae bacterium]